MARVAIPSRRKKTPRKRKRKQRLGQQHAAILEDPVKFCAACWPDIKLTQYQRDILHSLRDNVETFVHAANEVGKDFITAIGVLWFFCSRRPARVITSSSGETQLKSILWSEIRERINTSRIKFPFKLGTLSIKWVNEDGEEDPLSYIIGHVTKSVENFQGHHLDHDKPRVLCVFDEASGVGDEFDEAADSWAHRKLVIGNPLNCLNFFYRACKKGDIEHDADTGETGLLRKIIHVGAEHSPNVVMGEMLHNAGVPGPYPTVVPGVLSYHEYRRRLKIWDKIKIHMRVHGHFYEGDETLLYPSEWLDKAEAVYEMLCPQGYEASLDPIGARVAAAMGVDCGGGRDLSVWTVINRNQLIYQFAIPTPDTMEIVNHSIRLMRRYKLRPERVAFDAGGGGKQIADRLRQMKYSVKTVFFGESPTPPKGLRIKRTEKKESQAERRQTYKNRRAEMYGMTREILDPSVNEQVFGLPVELHELRKEMAVMPMLYDHEGKMYLPPKDRPPSATGKVNEEIITIKKLLGHSPDRADSLVLAVFALLGQPEKRQVGALRDAAIAIERMRKQF